MKSIKLILLYGFLIWLIPFIAAFLIYPIRESDRILFESIMPVILTFSVVLFSVLYFKKPENAFLKGGIATGLIWFTISIILDLLMFMEGPMKMSFTAYLSDIGITYLIIPIITIGISLLFGEHKQVAK